MTSAASEWPHVAAPGSPEGLAHVRALNDRQPAAPDPSFQRRAHITWASQIQMRPVTWAWTENGRERIPAGSLSMAAGREGTGKSTFGIWLASQITRGTLAGNLHGNPRRVLYVAVEDSWEHTIAPRLEAAGADRTMVGRFDVVQEAQEHLIMSLPLDNALMEEAIVENDVALVVIDPLMSVLSELINVNDSRKVRSALDPLAKLADRTRCLLLGIAHFNKTSGSDPSSLITGSGAFKDVPRSVFGFVRDMGDTDAPRVMTQTKNSLGRDVQESLAYDIEAVQVDTPEGPTSVGRLKWLGVSDRSAQEILRDNHHGDSANPEDAADTASFLRGFLIDNGGESSMADVITAGKPLGYSMDMLKRAKRRAGVESTKSGMKGPWIWRLRAAPEAEERAEGSEERRDLEAAPFAPFAPPSPIACPECGWDLDSQSHDLNCSTKESA